MTPNIWSIKNLIKNVYSFRTNKSREQIVSRFRELDINGWQLIDGRVYFLSSENYANEKFDQVRSVKFDNLDKQISNSLLYQFIDSKIREKGFKKIRKRTFFLPRSNDYSNLNNHLTGINCYLNFAFTYTIDKISREKCFVLDPERVITQDGEFYNSKFARKINEKIISNSNNIFDYQKRIKTIAKFVEVFGKTFELESDNGNCLQFQIASSLKNELQFFEEPEIQFGQGKQAIWPKLGINRYGPLDYNETIEERPEEIKIALVGTSSAFKLLRYLNEGQEKGKYKFLGIPKVYKSSLEMSSNRYQELSDEEIKEVDSQDEVCNLFLDKVQKLKNKGVQFDLCLLEIQDEWERFKQSEGTDLRDKLKVVFSKKNVNTQLITSNSIKNIQEETLSNLALGIYYKAGGNPWRIKTEYQNIAYIGISFGYVKSSNKKLIGIAELFDTYGQFISLRSMAIKEIPLDDYFNRTRDYHLSQESFSMVVHKLLDDYKASVDGTLPKNLVIHKTTYFNTPEQNIVSELQDFPFDISLVHVQKNNFYHLITDNYKEPNRGTYWEIDDAKALIYTTGILADKDNYFGLGAPLPIIINLNWSDNFSIKDISKQIIELTKLNFNSTNSYTKEPVTLLHSRKIVDLLRVGLDETSIPENPRYYL